MVIVSHMKLSKVVVFVGVALATTAFLYLPYGLGYSKRTETMVSSPKSIVPSSPLEHKDNSSCCEIASKHKLEELCPTNKTVWEIGVFRRGTNCSCADFLRCKLVVVTALSDSHFDESTDFFGSVHTKLPEVKIIVYDLGLSANRVKVLQAYCNVKEVRKFNFGKYPKHTKDLYIYAWKPFIMNEISQDYELFLYCDSSCRITDKFAPFIPNILIFPIICLYTINHDIFRYTHSGMLEYFKINKTRVELMEILPVAFQGGVNLVWANNLFRTQILKPWVDCAEHVNCIAPKGASRFGCNTNAVSQYIGCHRYDQSALNVILVKEFGERLKTLFNSKTGIPVPISVISIERTKTFHHNSNASHSCNIHYPSH